MTAYATDRDLIERILIPGLLQTVIAGVRSGMEEDADQIDGLTELLNQALKEPVAKEPPERVAKLVRRAKRATMEALEPLQGELVGIQLLAVAFLA